jgi:menaquinone-9 beta-reductase
VATPSDAATDVLIVGGGPAGLATAIEARRAGLTARVVDRARPPIDKACGEGLMPDAAARLAELGVELPAGAGFRFRGIRYLDGPLVATGDFPRGAGLGVRRLDLHAALVRRAAEVGAALDWETTVRALQPDGIETDRGPLRARWVVGADGLLSRVRRWAGLEAAPAPRRRFGVRRHFRIAPWSDYVEVYWGPGCEAYVSPVAPDLVGVACLWSGAAAGFDDLLARFPPLAARLAGAPEASRDRGAGPLEQRVRRAWRGRVALVGDAAGYLDAITGEGIAVALHQARALAAALAAGDLARYGAAHRRLRRLPNATIRLALAFSRRPRLRARALRTLAADPAFFGRILGIHARTLPPRALGAGGALRILYALAAG